MQVKDGNKVEFVRQSDHAPEQTAVWRVRREWAVLVAADERIREIAEELVVVVKFAISARVNVAGKNSRAFVDSPAHHDQELAITLLARVEEKELGAGSRGLQRIHIKFPKYVTVFIPEAKQYIPT